MELFKLYLFITNLFSNWWKYTFQRNKRKGTYFNTKIKNLNRHFPNFLQCQRNNGSKLQLSFISNLDFKQLFFVFLIIIIIIYSGYPLHRSVFQWGPAKIMYNTVTIRYDTMRYDTISFFQCSFLQLVSLEKSWILVENRCF